MDWFLLFAVVKVVLCSFNLHVIGFRAAVDILKNTIATGGDIKPCIVALNQKSHEVLVDGTFLSDNFLKEYISSKEEAIILLCENPTTDFETIEIRGFNQFLLNDLQLHEDYFSIDSLPQIINFLIKAASKCDARETKRLASKLIDKLDSERLQQLNKLIEYTKKEVERPVELEIIENRIISSADDPEAIYGILNELTISGQILSIDAYTNLVKYFHLFDFRLNPDWFYPTLDALKDIFILLKSNLDFQTAAVDFILSEKVILLLPTDRVIDSFCLLLALSLREKEISAARLEAMDTQMIQHFKPYLQFVKEITKIFSCLHIIQSLNNDSNEANFRMALSAITNLKRMETTDPMLKQIITLEYDVIKSSITSFFRVYANEEGPLFLISWKTVCMLGLLCYDISEGQERRNNCTNIAAGIGYLLICHNKASCNYPTDIINDILPNIDHIVESTLVSIKIANIPINFARLAGIIK